MNLLTYSENILSRLFNLKSKLTWYTKLWDCHIGRTADFWVPKDISNYKSRYDRKCVDRLREKRSNQLCSPWYWRRWLWFTNFCILIKFYESLTCNRNLFKAYFLELIFMKLDRNQNSYILNHNMNKLDIWTSTYALSLIHI